MREIKFRGKMDYNYYREERWISGYYCEKNGESYIINSWGQEILVDWETVGEWTGLKDPNGVEIYEGDVVSCSTFRGVVKYGSYTASFQAVSAGWWPASLEYDKHDPFEVVGNIFDNPELNKQFGEVYRKEQ